MAARKEATAKAEAENAARKAADDALADELLSKRPAAGVRTVKKVSAPADSAADATQDKEEN